MTQHQPAQGTPAERTPKPTDPADGDHTEMTNPGGQVQELIETAERSGASTEPADSDIGEAQLEEHRDR